MALRLRNPHSVIAAFEERPQDVLEVRLFGSRPAGAWADAVELARRHSVPVLRESRPAAGRRQRGAGDEAGRAGAAEATLKEKRSVELNELFSDVNVPAKGRLWLALDQIQDPHNVGAIFRSAAFFDVRGLVITRDRSAPLNATVYDVSSGGVEYVPFSVQTNLSRALREAKKAGLWILGSSEHADADVSNIDRDRPWLLVLGNEEKGLRQLTLKSCDEVCRLSRHGRVSSLNVSVAAGILLAALTGAAS